MKPTTEDKLASLFKAVETKRQELDTLRKITKRPWVTNCVWSFKQDGSDKKNLATMTQEQCIELLTQSYTQLVTLQHVIGELEAAGIHYTHELTIQGYTREQWFVDVTKRLTMLNIRDKENEFNKWEDRLNGLVSPEQKRLMELELLEKEIGI